MRYIPRYTSIENYYIFNASNAIPMLHDVQVRAPNTTVPTDGKRTVKEGKVFICDDMPDTEYYS
jgi:hypothetical protein